MKACRPWKGTLGLSNVVVFDEELGCTPQTDAITVCTPITKMHADLSSRQEVAEGIPRMCWQREVSGQTVAGF